MNAPDGNTIRDLVNRRYPQGVLSVYAFAPPDRPGEWEPTVRADLEHAALELDDEDRERKALFARARGRVEAGLADRLGRPLVTAVAGFVDLASGVAGDTWVDLNVPVTSSVSIAERPNVAPLVRIVSIAARSGVLCAGGTEATIHEWESCTLRRLATFRVSVDTDDWRRYQGPAGGAGGRRYESMMQGDLYRRNVLAEREDRLRQLVAPSLRRMARAGSWERVVVFGPPAFHALVTELPGVHHIDGGARRLTAEPVAALTTRVARLLRQHVLLTELELAHEAVSSPQGRAVLGLRDVFSLARDRRIERLLVADRSEAPTSVPSSIANELIELTVRSGGDVMPLEGEAARLLASHDGIAALLRY